MNALPGLPEGRLAPRRDKPALARRPASAGRPGGVPPGLPARLGGVPPGLPERLGGVPPGLPERLGGVPPRRAILLASLAVGVLFLETLAEAHGVTRRDAAFVQSIDGPAIGPFMYLGAKHMVTGYDHLLFLVGVIFFLYRLKDVVKYVSVFTLGHSLTLLAGVLGNVRADAYIVDAIIGLSIVYKAFENMGGFERLGFRPNTAAAVMIFGLFHGFGLATKLQELAIPQNGLVANIVSFNVGVEIGQGLALTAVLIAISYWRQHPGFLRHSFATNTALMTGGFILMGYQLAGYFQQ